MSSNQLNWYLNIFKFEKQKLIAIENISTSFGRDNYPTIIDLKLTNIGIISLLTLFPWI